jgi:hypothetical protein
MRAQQCESSGDAKNPEGVLAEALTLSGFPTLLALQPRRTGLPARSQSHLSVTFSPIWSCLQVGSATIGPRFSGGQVEQQMKFRDLAIFFASPRMRAITRRLLTSIVMADQEQVTQLRHLLAQTAREHHEAHGTDPSPQWAAWYATRLQPEMGSFVGFEPTVEEISAWLRDADEKYRAEDDPEEHWPAYYAELILDSVAVTEG